MAAVTIFKITKKIGIEGMKKFRERLKKLNTKMTEETKPSFFFMLKIVCFQ